MIRKQALSSLGGPISTGKEGNVYYAFTPTNDLIAAKIYKLETSSFHTMSKYIIGDPRFQNIKKNRRSIVYNWCKKEYRNLSLANEVGVRVPLPLAFKNNVLVMEFIGSHEKGEAEASLPLKNIKLSEKQAEHCYEKVTEYIARLFYKARLVHGDLSEYNILGFNNGKKIEPVIIDMGQGVLTSHPLAQELLDRDLEKIANYFQKYSPDITIEKTREKVKKHAEKINL